MPNAGHRRVFALKQGHVHFAPVSTKVREKKPMKRSKVQGGKLKGQIAGCRMPRELVPR